MYFQKIMADYPVRNSNSEKEAFRAWALEQAKEAGYRAEVETNGKHRNIVIGDAENARVIFTAHYDTPKRSLFPNIMLPANRVLAIVYQFSILIPLIGLSLAAFFLVLGGDMSKRPQAIVAFMIVYYGLWFLLFRTFKNTHNANDNTSGISAALETMRALPTGKRDGAAFILFDNEEKGKLGSKAYAKAHGKIKADTLIVNMDCVGLGKHLIVTASDHATANKEYKKLCEALQPIDGMEAAFFVGKQAKLNSDHLNFSCGVCLAACKKSRRIGYYTPYIHTSRDTVVDESNLTAISGALKAFVMK